MTARKKKSAREKRVAIASIIVAATIVAGSTFAWFTSQDEVTNRLTAHADYGVSIVEDFKPPEDWVPGQEINKDVSAVNTGNVDAYVRLGLLYDSKMTVAGEGVALSAFETADKTTLVELKNKASTDNTPENGNAVANSANEVTLLQAGGTLVIAGGQAVTPSDAWNVRSGDDSDSNTDYSGSGQFDPATTMTVADPSKTYAEQYGSGVYIFQRTVYETTGNTTKYSGYYYDKDSDKFYELVQQPHTVYLPDGAVTVSETAAGVVTTTVTDNVKLANTNEVTISNTATGTAASFEIKWMKDATTAAADNKSDATMIRLTYVGNKTETADTLDDVIIDIKLADGWNSKWTYVSTTTDKVNGTNDTGYFYYNEKLAPGATTDKLVDSVTLNKAVTDEAYKDLVFDLSVVLDSVQVIKKEDGTYANDSFATWNVTGLSVDQTTGNLTVSGS